MAPANSYFNPAARQQALDDIERWNVLIFSNPWEIPKGLDEFNAVSTRLLAVTDAMGSLVGRAVLEFKELLLEILHTAEREQRSPRTLTQDEQVLLMRVRARTAGLLEALKERLKSDGSEGDRTPPGAAWEFAIGRFRYGDKWFDLSGQKLALLETFVSSLHHTLLHNEIRGVCSPQIQARRPYAYVSELNKALCKLFKLNESPICPVRGENAYRFDLSRLPPL
jgi:hypothetical protein